ncbi:3-phytase [Pseudidiomarina sediminum]|uniref:3-phytase n=1 Tax=Pseudidiomarina sediminum TaxID=431675 RepID=A0A432Z499_9GAMM|nr:phytase [Pseudidiomarina sediminum]RUO72707.1 3-phytase [Pseudidiomarina sediminum]
MKLKRSTLALALFSASACTSQATDLQDTRHQVQHQGHTYSVTSEGLYAAGQLVRRGEFEHLRSLALEDGGLVMAAMEGNTQFLHLWLAQGDNVDALWQGEISSRVVEDLCFYQSQENQQTTLFLLGGRGGAEQLLLRQDQQWLAQPLAIRDVNVPFDATACAVDQQRGTLFVAEADQAVWAYQAEPEVDEGRQLVAAKAPFGQLQNEIKGLEVLHNGALAVLEEEPPRLLMYTREEDGLQFSSAQAIAELEALTDVVELTPGQLLLTHEDGLATRTAQVPVATSVSAPPATPVNQVAATLQTTPSPRRGDAIDDPAVWVHPQQPAQSRILATDKRTGLYVYDMNGAVVQELAIGRLNNVDVRGNVAAATLRDDNSIQLFEISAEGEFSLGAKVRTDVDEIYGLCMGYDAQTEQTSVYINNKGGRIQHFVLTADGATFAREMTVPSQPEGCVVDDATQRLFVGEEDVAVWQFDARASATTQGQAVIHVADHAELVDDIEGLAYAVVDGEPLLFVSSQGNDSYIVFDGEAPWALRSHFRIRTNPAMGIDGASETDGIEVTTANLGPQFPQGALLVQDGRNRMPEAGQNVKVVPLEAILQTLNSHE